MQVYINNQKTNSQHLFYDEHYYEKYIEGKEIYQFDINIELDTFNKIIQPKYEELLNELIEDDKQTGENYALELFENLTEYPSYEDILNDTKIGMKEKMSYLNAFFISQILNIYFNQKSNFDNKRWVIREVLYLNQKENNVIIKGNAQKID
ncbi:uncharacterized protein CHSO_1450 [Chryseobacterium sp. StRB126]|uniref:hypothetical protein n=1 Tax=Chryseobacterium sp. StRB126 TaxID=878220 RepID=UPI0004E9897F|nr:hypothetical protein [Chryseobacterium sp. StRB126]BAP30487.1 uncharacterized protein CHSO_1450 [Chryseobacterium sp. StRB126]